jgi:cell division septation protein DedD
MNSKLLFLFVALAFVALMAGSCAKQAKVAAPTEEVPVAVEEEGGDTTLEVSLPESLVVTETPPIVTPSPAIVPAQTYGYRVQIGAFSSQSNAEMFASAARSRFSERVYVEFVSPYNKVRVGDLLSREEAEGLKARALQMGYPGSFIVETMVSPGQ